MKIAVVGTGYVGLVTGTCLAEAGNRVTCVDVDEAKVATLRGGGVPIYEPGLEELLRRNTRERRLDFTVSIAEAMEDTDVAFIAVGTPAAESGAADLSAVFAVAEEIGRCIRKYTVVVSKSTVPVGTCERITEIVAREAQGPFDVVSNPEFLKEGSAIEDFMRPDRVVVGALTVRAREVMAEVYQPLFRQDQRVQFMDPRSAELTKYAANAMLAARIAFMNDVALLCDRLGADVDAVRRGVGADKRIGSSFLFPGVGFGGSCFPKDIRALMTMARQVGLDFDLLRSVERINERQKRLLFDVALKHFGSLVGKRVGVWGLSFKPRTDDLREASSLVLIQLLAGAGAAVRAHDPVAAESASRQLGPHIEMARDPYGAAEGADGLFLVTEWTEFRNPDFERLRSTMRGRALFDGRNAWDATRARAAGFAYFGVGRGR